MVHFSGRHLYTTDAAGSVGTANNQKYCEGTRQIECACREWTIPEDGGKGVEDVYLDTQDMVMI